MGHSAVALEEVEGASEAVLLEAGGQLPDVLHHPGSDVGVEHRGADPVVLADLGQYVPGGGDERLGEDAAAQLCRSHLMGGIEERPQEADGNRLHPFPDHELAGGQHPLLVQRHHHMPVGVEPLDDR